MYVKDVTFSVILLLVVFALAGYALYSNPKHTTQNATPVDEKDSKK